MRRPSGDSARAGATSLLLLALMACTHAPSHATRGRPDSMSYVVAPARPDADAADALSDAIGLTLDDTIFTESARTRNFTGQGLLPRLTYVRSTEVYDGDDRVADPLDREARVCATRVRGVLGLHEDVTVAVNVAYVERRLEMRAGGRRVTLRSAGLGDVSGVAKWRFWKRPEPGETTEAAVLLGAEFPTGRADAEDGGDRLPAPLQPGSGSLDGIAGVAFTRVWDGGRWLVNADTIWKRTTEANDYRFGSVIRFDVGLQYRAVPVRYERYDQFTLNVVLELNVEHAGRDRAEGHRVDGTGGTKWFLSPGVQAIVSDSLLFEAGVQVPVRRDLHGPQLAEDLRITLGLRWLF